ERIGHIRLTLFDLLEPRLRTLLRAAVVVGERARDRAPEQVGRCGDEAMRSELIGDRDNVRINAVHRTSKHNGRNLSAGLRGAQIAIELAALARAHLDPLPRHRMPPFSAHNYVLMNRVTLPVNMRSASCVMRLTISAAGAMS